MSTESTSPIQLEIFGESPAHRTVIETYEWIRPVLTQQRTLAEQNRHMGTVHIRA